MAHSEHPSSAFGTASGTMFEELETRIVLSAVDGLPDVSDLETSTNPVVVMETEFGDIYIELFEQDAPLSVANFLEYVERGLYGESFFHRSQPGFVLQGGGFAFNEDLGLQAVFDPDLGPVVNEFGRPNLERTIAYARTSDPDSATSQFFFNLADNSAILDPQNFTVFGRVITDDSWNAVQSIVGLSIEDLRDDDSFQDQLVDRFGNPLFRDASGFLTLDDTGTEAFGDSAMGSDGFSLGGFPVRSSFDGDFDDGDEVEIINAQVVKPAGTDFFYEQVLALPEGFRSQRASDRLELVNPNSSDANVQVVVRYETGLRDRVVFDGTLSANEARTIVLHDRANGAEALVRGFTPFAVEVYTASAPVGGGSESTADDNLEPVAATLHHFDYGGVGSEGFANLSDAEERSLTWDFANVPVGSGVETYLVWQNLGDTATEVTVSFIGDTFAPFNRNFDLSAYRRGGMALFEETVLSSLPAGTRVGVRISASEEIVAAISSYETDTGLPVDDGKAEIAIGTPFQGRIEGVIPAAFIPSGGTGTLTALNANNSAAVIQLIARTASGDQFAATPVPFIMTAQSRAAINLATVFPLIPTDEPFSISYTSTTPVSLAFSADGVVGTVEDTMGSAVQIRAATVSHFGTGLLDPSAGNSDVVSIFNPFADETVSFDVEFRFSDGTLISLGTTTLGARENFNLDLSTVADLVTKASSDSAFTTFGITVRGFDEFGLDPRHLVTQLTRGDLRSLGERSEVLSVLPTLDGEILQLDDPSFDGGSPA